MGFFFYNKYGLTELEQNLSDLLSYLISFISFSILAVGVGGGNLIEASVACMAA